MNYETDILLDLSLSRLNNFILLFNFIFLIRKLFKYFIMNWNFLFWLYFFILNNIFWFFLNFSSYLSIFYLFFVLYLRNIIIRINDIISFGYFYLFNMYVIRFLINSWILNIIRFWDRWINWLLFRYFVVCWLYYLRMKDLMNLSFFNYLKL